jgi:8-oxo-dGTP pyrophosphatase MutT (NUDIX family)
MDQELLFVVDEHDKPLPPLGRKEVIATGAWRRAAGRAIIDKENHRILCQKRSESLDERPGLWIALFGGKSAPRETPLLTAQRELCEEMGIRVDQSALGFYKKIKSDERKQFEYLYWVYWVGEISRITFDPGEVSEVAWRDISEVVELLKHDENWYSYGYDIAMLESIDAL